VKSPIITVADIADIEGGSVALRSRLGALDVADAPAPGQLIEIGKGLISFRIRLAGLEAQCFRIDGPPLVRVMSEPGATIKQAAYRTDAGQPTSGQSGPREEDIIAVARKYLLEQMPWPSEDVVSTLAQPVRTPLFGLSPESGVLFDAEARLPEEPIGRVRVDVIAYQAGRRIASVPVLFDVRVYEQVAVATKPIAPGDRFSDGNTRFERRLVDAPDRCLTSTEKLAGKEAKRRLPAGHVIGLADVELAAAPETLPLVHRNEIVHVRARAGPLWVTAKGEALQDGRADQLIRVRNTDSNAIVLARVVERSVVQVDY
jgi:flagella basal body P-ring formation protein FlgA